MSRPTIEPLQIGHNPDGNILKYADKSILSKSRELYFSAVKPKRIKGWKLHKEMTMRLAVLAGEVSFCFRSQDGSFLESHILAFDSNTCLVVPPRLWFAFRNNSDHQGVVVNLASLEHSEQEVVRMPVDTFPFEEVTQ